MVVKVIGIVMFCIILAYSGFENVWKRKKKLENNSLEITIARLIIFSILFFLVIPVLVIQVSLEQNYTISVILLIAWTFAISLLAFNIRKCKGKTRK